MKNTDVSALSNEQLVAMYVDVSIRQADALLRNDLRRVNRLVDRQRIITETLRARGTEARRALIPLLDYVGQKSPWFSQERAQVRLNAATTLLAIVPEKARATLEELAARGPGDQKLSASMCLWHLETGVYKPT